MLDIDAQHFVAKSHIWVMTGDKAVVRSSSVCIQLDAIVKLIMQSAGFRLVKPIPVRSHLQHANSLKQRLVLPVLIG